MQSDDLHTAPEMPPALETSARPEPEVSPGASAARWGGFAPLRVLRHREFAIYWTGLAVSMVGTWMQSFAQGWVVAGLTTSAFVVGLVHFTVSAPTLVLMPLGGVAADRLERRRILLYTQWVILALALVMGTLIVSGRLELWHVFVVALLLGVATAYEMPAYQSFYPQLVEKEDLPQAVALNQATFQAARIVGPALAGWLVAMWGLGAAFFANAATFLAVIVSLMLVRSRPPPGDTERSSTLTLMREGFRYVRDRPAVQSLLALTGVTTFFIFPNVAFLAPYYVKHVLREGAAALGVIMSAAGVGAFVGAALLLTVPKEQRLLRMLLSAGVVLMGVSTLAWTQHLWGVVAAIGMVSAATAHSLGIASIMVQEAIPDALRGRVMSLYSLMFSGTMPLGALVLPGLTDWLGMRVELQLAAVLYAAGAFAALARLRRSLGR